ncbi:MAG: hypothetical protein ISP83_07235 [Candidatus Poseidonia sp.]|nr:hypothetical protein [Poseidonia sp.]MBL6748010.1 hypothetical protein [Poseidonia sp.]MBL6806894.1 hypothetical protein [Poseidonia sp.]MBL6885910.1 hypothetical protein [Poseidonia sp.]MBL6892818.1 hypothetical protein [Poseidonia sp.]
MTTDANSTNWFARLAPRGSLQRFGIAGGFNSGAFFLLWELLMALSTDIDIRYIWGFSWGVTGVMAHFVHRHFTFNARKSVRWTLPTAVPVYGASLVGSSMTIGILSEAFPDNIRWLGLANLLAWGLLIWLAMRVFVFQFQSESTSHVSLEGQVE